MPVHNFNNFGHVVETCPFLLRSGSILLFAGIPYQNLLLSLDTRIC